MSKGQFKEKKVKAIYRGNCFYCKKVGHLKEIAHSTWSIRRTKVISIIKVYLYLVSKYSKALIVHYIAKTNSHKCYDMQELAKDRAW